MIDPDRLADFQAERAADPDLLVELRRGIAARLNVDKRWVCAEHRLDGALWRSAGLTVIWSAAIENDQRPWLHVSASRFDRLPSYTDMTRVKQLFVGPHRFAYTVMPPEDEHVNIHSRCLHLWSNLSGPPPLPDFTAGMGTI